MFSLSYRRFLALVSGLSGESVFLGAIHRKQQPSSGEREPVKRLHSREEVAAFFRNRKP